MLSASRLLKIKNPPAPACLIRFLTTKTASSRIPRLQRGAICFTDTRPAFMLSERPRKATVINLLITQKRQFSLWNIPLSLMTASPLKRRLTLAATVGAGLAIAVVLGPFLLVGIGGIAAVMGFRMWRIKRNIQSQLQRTGQPLQDWPDFLSTFMQQQGTGLFGHDQRLVETEAMRRFELWAQSDGGRNQLIEYGIYPEKITRNVAMRGSSYTSTSSNVTGTTTEVKIELDLRNAPGAVLIASARLDKDNDNLTIKDMKLVTAAGQVLTVPLSVSQQNPGGARVIEGEFHDV